MKIYSAFKYGIFYCDRWTELYGEFDAMTGSIASGFNPATVHKNKYCYINT